MKQYNYLVSFSHGEGGWGTAHVTRGSKLDSFNKLTELAKWIGAQNNMANVAITSFQLVNVSRVKRERKKNAKNSD